MNGTKYREILDENLLQSTQGEGSPSNTTTLSTQPRQRRSGFGTGLKVLECFSQSPDLNPIEHPWRDLKIAVLRCSPSNLTELERVYKEEWKKLSKYRCAKLVSSHPRRLEAVITFQRCFNKVLSKGFEYLCKCTTFANISKNLCHYGVVCVD
jgi:hypothetical protein